MRFQAVKTVTEAKRRREHIVATSLYDLMGELERNAFSKLADTVLYVIFDYGCYAYNLLVRGRIDAVAGCRRKLNNFAKLAPILEGAGCVVSD